MKNRTIPFLDCGATMKRMLWALALFCAFPGRSGATTFTGDVTATGNIIANKGFYSGSGGTGPGTYYWDGSQWRGINYWASGGWMVTYGSNNVWTTLWHAGNDGSGSGLDADKLDGLNSTSFWTSSNDGAGSGLDADRLDGMSSSSFLTSEVDGSATNELQLLGVSSGTSSTSLLTLSNTGGTVTFKEGTSISLTESATSGTITISYLPGDATTLDGFDSSAFARKAESAVVTALWSFENNLKVGKAAGGDAVLQFVDGSSGLLKQFSWSDALDSFSFDSKVISDQSFQGSKGLYSGESGFAVSAVQLWDDSSIDWREIRWDGAVDDWQVEDNGGVLQTLYHSGNIQNASIPPQGGISMGLFTAP